MAFLNSHPNIKFVITDIGLPKMSGIELVQQIRECSLHHLPIVMFSAQHDVVRTAANLGVVAGIEKGSEGATERLVAHVAAYLH